MISTLLLGGVGVVKLDAFIRGTFGVMLYGLLLAAAIEAMRNQNASNGEMDWSNKDPDPWEG